MNFLKMRKTLWIVTAVLLLAIATAIVLSQLGGTEGRPGMPGSVASWRVA